VKDIRCLYQEGGSREFDRNSIAGLKKSLSKCHDVNQALIRNVSELQDKLRRSQIVNTALTAIITALAFKGLEVLFQALR
jgi:hypothetical protein